MESTHYGELTARQTQMVRALIQDKMEELEDGQPEILQELKEVLDIFGGPITTQVQ